MYHKSVLDKKSPSTVARLGKQVQILYEDAERHFGVPSLQQYFDKSWLAHTQLKASWFDVETLMQSSRALRAEDKVNSEIAVLQEAFKRLQATKKFAKAVSMEMVDSANRQQETIQLMLTKAEKENSTIYLQRVPHFADLPAIQGALLVKPLPPASLTQPMDNLFSGLIPDSCAKALSKYTDMVDGIIREQLDRLATATDTARIKLKEWELPDTVEALDAKTSQSLPDGLCRELEEVASIGGVSHIKGILAEIGDLRRVCDEDLFAAQGALDAEAQADGEARARWGDR